jgi:hypothetical protein
MTEVDGCVEPFPWSPNVKLAAPPQWLCDALGPVRRECYRFLRTTRRSGFVRVDAGTSSGAICVFTEAGGHAVVFLFDNFAERRGKDGSRHFKLKELFQRPMSCADWCMLGKQYAPSGKFLSGVTPRELFLGLDIDHTDHRAIFDRLKSRIAGTDVPVPALLPSPQECLDILVDPRAPLERIRRDARTSMGELLLGYGRTRTQRERVVVEDVGRADLGQRSVRFDSIGTAVVGLGRIGAACLGLQPDVTVSRLMRKLWLDDVPAARRVRAWVDGGMDGLVIKKGFVFIPIEPAHALFSVAFTLFLRRWRDDIATLLETEIEGPRFDLDKKRLATSPTVPPEKRYSGHGRRLSTSSPGPLEDRRFTFVDDGIEIGFVPTEALVELETVDVHHHGNNVIEHRTARILLGREEEPAIPVRPSTDAAGVVSRFPLCVQRQLETEQGKPRALKDKQRFFISCFFESIGRVNRAQLKAYRDLLWRQVQRQGGEQRSRAKLVLTRTSAPPLWQTCADCRLSTPEGCIAALYDGTVSTQAELPRAESPSAVVTAAFRLNSERLHRLAISREKKNEALARRDSVSDNPRRPATTS